MKDTIQTTLITETQPELIQKTCRTLSSSLEDFLVKLSALLENEKDLTKQEEHYFLRLQGFSETKHPLIFYSKTLKAYYLMIGAELSKPFFGSAMNLGMNVIVLDVNAGAWKLETERGVIMNGDKSEHLLEAIPVMGCYCDITIVSVSWKMSKVD